MCYGTSEINVNIVEDAPLSMTRHMSAKDGTAGGKISAFTTNF